VAVPPAAVSAQGSRAKRAARLLEEYHDLRLFNGAALILDGDAVLYRGAVGFADLESEAPNGAATRFPIPSGLAPSDPDGPEVAPSTDGADRAIGYEKRLEGYVPASLGHPIDALDGMSYVTVDDLASWSRSQPPDVEISGDTLGVSWLLRHVPDPDGTIVLLDNTSSNLTALAEALTALLRGTEVPSPKPSIAERLLPVIKAAGVEPALARYREWRRTRPGKYDYGPEELMRLAAHFREADDAQSAIMVLETAAEEFPSHALAAVALAELYTEAGDSARAVSRLEATLQRVPGDLAVLETLVALGVEPSPALRSPIQEVAVESLARLVGEYEIDPSTTLAVRLDGDGLTAARTGEPAFPLLPQSETTFLLEGSEIQMIFQVDGDEAAAVSILESGQSVTFPRVQPTR